MARNQLPKLKGHHEGKASDAKRFRVQIGSARYEDEDEVLLTTEATSGEHVLIEVRLSAHEARSLATFLEKMASSVEGDAIKQKRKAVRKSMSRT